MASEAEFERLYQEWVRNGGGTYTFDSSTQTPAQYYDATSTTELSPEQIAALEAAQEQYNRQAALNTILSEVNSNNFSNPYDTRASIGIQSYTNLANDPGTTSVTQLGSTIESISDVTTRNALYDLLGGSSTTNSIFGIPTLPALAIGMFTSLRTHTNEQMIDFPGKLQEISSLANMNKSFGDIGGMQSCSLFNSLMGILAGSFDTAIDFAMQGVDKLIQLLSPITSIIDQITNTITDFISGAISDVLGAVESLITGAFSEAIAILGDLINNITDAVTDVVNQIAAEAAGLLAMAAELVSKAAALAMAAAALDPCQMAAILNVGSQQLKGAINQLQTPLSTTRNLVETENDSRANPEVVQRTMDEAKNAALRATGVPQSPLRGAQTAYAPLSSYFHNVSNNKDEIFTNQLESVGEKVSAKERKVKDTLGSQAGANSDDVGSRSESTETQIKSDAYKQFFNESGKDMLSTRSRINSLIKKIQDNKPTLGYEQKSRADILIEKLSRQQQKISVTMTSIGNDLEYTVKGNKNRDENYEQQHQNMYDSLLKSKAQRTVTRASTVYTESNTEWESIVSNNTIT